MNGTVPVGRPLARLPGRLDLLLRLVADVGSVPLDEVDRDVMELAEIVRGVRDLRGRERRGGVAGKRKRWAFFFLSFFTLVEESERRVGGIFFSPSRASSRAT